MTKITALLVWLERLRLSRPASATMFRTAGSWRRHPSTRCTTASVRCSDEPSGSWIAGDRCRVDDWGNLLIELA